MDNGRAETVSGLDLRPAPVFIVGAGRSGTTWLQMLLAGHPAIASAPETEIFAGYLARLWRRWEMEEALRSDAGTCTGLHDLLSRQEFFELSGQALVERVWERILARKSGASVVLEKTPHNVFYARQILALLPNARFIHIIRDPRAVVASLRTAARGWGKHWAPRGAAGGTILWKDAVRAGLDIPTHTPRYYQVHYETLSADPATELSRMFAWLELDVDIKTAHDFVAACDITQLRAGRGSASTLAPSNSSGQFFRRGALDGWRDELSRLEIAIIETMAADLMEGLSYSPLTGRYRPVAHAILAARRLATGLQWRTEHALKRLASRL